MKDQNMELLTDLYELTMAAVYFQEKMFEPATFSLFIRDYPEHHAYFISAGLEEVLSFLESFHFSSESLGYLESTGLIKQDTIALRGEDLEGEPMWQRVMESGERMSEPETLDEIRERCAGELERLDDRYRAINNPDRYTVNLSPSLEELQQRVERDARENELL